MNCFGEIANGFHLSSVPFAINVFFLLFLFLFKKKKEKKRK